MSVLIEQHDRSLTKNEVVVAKHSRSVYEDVVVISVRRYV